LALYGDAYKLPDKQVYSPHHYYIYDLTPDYENELGTFHNSFGFRSKEIQKQKPDDTYRIFFMGGSTTYTTEVKDNKKTYTYLLEQELNKKLLSRKDCKYNKIEIVNAGVGGFTSAENLIRVIFKISEFSPDLVVIQHGFNDVMARLCGEISSDYSNYRKSWYQAKETANPLFTTFKRKIRKSRLLTFVCIRLGLTTPRTLGFFTVGSWNPQVDNLKHNDCKYFERNTEYMVMFLKMIGADVILVSEPYNDNARQGRIKAMPQHNTITKEVANKLNCSFFDLYQSFPKYEPYLQSDGTHVSEKGSYKKYELLRDFLINDFQLFSRF